jgi:hypothetical protein
MFWRPKRVGALYAGRRESERIVYAGKLAIGLPLWLLPRLEAEVAYSNVTSDGMLRHGPCSRGLRADLA